MYRKVQSSTDKGLRRVGVRRGQARLAGESPQKSPQSNYIACSQLDGQVENPRSDKIPPVLEGVGGVNRGGQRLLFHLAGPPKLLSPSTGAVIALRAFYWD